MKYRTCHLALVFAGITCLHASGALAQTEPVSPDPALSPSEISAPPVLSPDAIPPDPVQSPEQTEAPPALSPDDVPPEPVLSPN